MKYLSSSILKSSSWRSLISIEISRLHNVPAEDAAEKKILNNEDPDKGDQYQHHFIGVKGNVFKNLL